MSTRDSVHPGDGLNPRDGVRRGDVANPDTVHAPPWLERRGSGAPLVLLHGWGLNLRVFDPLAAELGAQHELIALDLPGHGRSGEPATLERGWDPAVLADVLWEALPPRVALLGWSLGGQAALAMALRAPQRVRALVLASTTPRFLAAPGWPQGIAPAVLERFGAQLLTDPAGTIRDFLELQVRGSRDAAATLIALQEALRAHGAAAPAALERALGLLRTADLRAELGAIAAPALVLGGQYDRVTPPGAARALAAALPDARHLEFARCGHAPFISHAAEFAAAVRSFLAGVAP